MEHLLIRNSYKCEIIITILQITQTAIIIIGISWALKNHNNLIWPIEKEFIRTYSRLYVNKRRSSSLQMDHRSNPVLKIVWIKVLMIAVLILTFKLLLKKTLSQVSVKFSHKIMFYRFESSSPKEKRLDAKWLCLVCCIWWRFVEWKYAC